MPSAEPVRKARPLPHSPHRPVREDEKSGTTVTTSAAVLDPIYREAYRSMLKASPCLFGKDILGLQIPEHFIEWEEIALGKRRACINAAREHGKSTFFTYLYPIWRIWRDPGEEMYLFSKTLEQAMEFIDIILYGRANLRGMVDIPQLQNLVPSRGAAGDDHGRKRDPRERLTRQDVRFTNMFRLRAVGYGKAIRGRHPRWVICDDVLNDEDMWSETVRTKNIEYYKSAIVNMPPEDGQIIIVGTPYHAADLYGWAKRNSEYCFRRFPGIIRNKKTGEEKPLFPWKWSLKGLYGKKREIGSVSFAREIMCEPVTDDMSIFPSWLFPPLKDTTLTMRPSLKTIKERGWSVYFGVDLARSANTGADYFVVFVIAKDPVDGKRYVIDIRRAKGLTFKKQLEFVEMLAQRYEPGLIFIEANQYQQVFTDEMRRTTDLPVKEFVTHATNKYPLDKGIPSLRILLENEKVCLPYGDAYSQVRVEEFISEATQFGFVDGKLQGIGEHDDMVMAWWFCEEALKAGGFSFSMGDEDEGKDDDEDEDGESWEDVMLGKDTGEQEDEDGLNNDDLMEKRGSLIDETLERQLIDGEI